MLRDKKYVKFDNPNIQLKTLENLYYHITKRKYLKFDSGCSACVRESLTIINNWVKKNPEFLENDAVSDVIEPQNEPEIELKSVETVQADAVEAPIEQVNEVKKGVAKNGRRRK
ncbi:hypothetical protein CHU00_18450 [Sphingobacterium cellulitidis]|nr:hypothetical protein CHU00_18450 [Sphingobacterium cellulitidis]